MTDIPPEIIELCRDIDGYPAKVTEHSCVVDFHGIELRFQRNTDFNWEWDEVVGRCALHIEQMDINYFWLGINPIDAPDKRICVNIGAKRAPVTMTGWIE